MASAFPDKSSYFEAEAQEAAMSRLWGGIHFPQDNDPGLDIGRRLGAKVVGRMQAEGRPL